MSEMVALVLKRETAQTLLDKAPAHNPGEVFHGLRPHQLDLRYALERALATDSGDDWHPVLLSRERPGAMLGFAGAPEFIAERGGELQHYVPVTQPEPPALLQALEGEIERQRDAGSRLNIQQARHSADTPEGAAARAEQRALYESANRLQQILDQYGGGGS